MDNTSKLICPECGHSNLTLYMTYCQTYKYEMNNNGKFNYDNKELFTDSIDDTIPCDIYFLCNNCNEETDIDAIDKITFDNLFEEE